MRHLVREGDSSNKILQRWKVVFLEGIDGYSHPPKFQKLAIGGFWINGFHKKTVSFTSRLVWGWKSEVRICTFTESCSWTLFIVEIGLICLANSGVGQCCIFVSSIKILSFEFSLRPASTVTAAIVFLWLVVNPIIGHQSGLDPQLKEESIFNLNHKGQRP